MDSERNRPVVAAAAVVVHPLREVASEDDREVLLLDAQLHRTDPQPVALEVVLLLLLAVAPVLHPVAAVLAEVLPPRVDLEVVLRLSVVALQLREVSVDLLRLADQPSVVVPRLAQLLPLALR